MGDNHHHLVCRECGLTVDIDCVTGAAPCLDTPGPSGFVVDEAEVTFWGLCPTCQLTGAHPLRPRIIRPEFLEDANE